MKRITLFFLTVLMISLSAAAADPINVAGVDVKCNADATITGGDIKSGTVTYTKSTNTLTLTNVTITRTGSNDYCIHNRSQKGLIVKFVGTCNLTSKARVIRMQCGGWGDTSPTECQLVATSGSTVNLKSTGDGAIYVRDFTWLWIKGPGTFNITGDKDGAIAGHGDWNSSVSDLRTVDGIKFSNVTATVTGAQSALLGLYAVYFYAGSNVTLKASNSSSYPVARQLLSCYFNDNTAILSPPEATYSSNNESFVLNGSKIYNQDIYISDNYALRINSTNFPDANFRNAMLSLYPKGYLTNYDLQNLTSLNVANKSISNMTGIEKLTYLRELRCYGNSFSSLNVSALTYLTYLDCAPNSNLTTLNVSGCTNLETLICYSTGITSLSLGNLNKLKKLSCYDTKLTSLTVNGKGYLTELYCQNCTSLTYLDCNNCKLSTLNVTGNTALNYLYCYGNSNLSSITGLADCTAIKTLNCSNCALTDLGAVNSINNIESLSATSNKLTSITLNNKSKLTYVALNENLSLTSAEIYGNSALTQLFVNTCYALTYLTCTNNALTTLNVTGCSALKELRCYYNSNLATITGLASCTALTYLDCEDCKISDLSALKSLNNITTLYARNNKLTYILLENKSKLSYVRLTGNTSLTTADIYNNSALTSLHITGCTALQLLSCDGNNLTSLSLTGCTALTQLHCYGNKLTSLDLSEQTNLTSLWCSNNQLTTLNLNYNTKLVYLHCFYNKLTSLNVSNKTKLKQLHCHNNQLTTLNVQGCSMLEDLNCCHNKLTSLYLQGCTALNKIDCSTNQISGSGMTTLVNSLPMRSSGARGTLYAIYYTNEGNTMTSAQITTAKNKYWAPMKYNGQWIEMSATVTGDVNGDGQVTIADLTELIDILLSSGTQPAAADVNGDGNVSIADVTELIDILLING